jgi:hypothetical protein
VSDQISLAVAWGKRTRTEEKQRHFALREIAQFVCFPFHLFHYIHSDHADHHDPFLSPHLTSGSWLLRTRSGLLKAAETKQLSPRYCLTETLTKLKNCKKHTPTELTECAMPTISTAQLGTISSAQLGQDIFFAEK